MTTALVTGCSTGIGYATALRLARDGHHVVATMRTPDASDLAKVAEADGLSLETRALDVTADHVEAVVAGVLADHGGVDILVNNAGIGGASAFEETELGVFREMMETNFFGALRCMQAVLPSMRERGSGCIVNVTSQAGVLAFPTMAPYCATKHALSAASESLAIEVAPFGIRVAVIEPGAIMTAIWGKADLTPPTGPYAPIGTASVPPSSRSSATRRAPTRWPTASPRPSPRISLGSTGWSGGAQNATWRSPRGWPTPNDCRSGTTRTRTPSSHECCPTADADLPGSPVVTYTHHIRVRYAEVDMQRVVFNANYLAYCDDAADLWFRGLGAELEDDWWDVMVKKAVVTWSGGAKVHDDLAIEVAVRRWGNTSFDVGFAGSVDGNPVFDAEITYVAVKTGTTETVRVPDEFRAAADAA